MSSSETPNTDPPTSGDTSTDQSGKQAEPQIDLRSFRVQRFRVDNIHPDQLINALNEFFGKEKYIIYVRF
jgi:hypothetical protein